MQRALGQADGLLSAVTDRLTAGVFAAYPLRTRIIANFGGQDTTTSTWLPPQAHDIVVTNTPDVLTDCTADLAMALVLMTMRRAGEGERELRNGRWTGWRPTHMMGQRVTGKTLGLVGMGRIARAGAAGAPQVRDARALLRPGAAITGQKLPSWVVEQRATLEALLGDSDVVSLHCPSTPATRGMINATRLAQMKRGAFLVNTARGDIVVDDAVVGALRSGHLAGAGLDVYRGEPAIERRYLELENVVLLPHLGSATVETRDAMGMRAIANLTAFFDGKPAPDRVT